MSDPASTVICVHHERGLKVKTEVLRAYRFTLDPTRDQLADALAVAKAF